MTDHLHSIPSDSAPDEPTTYVFTLGVDYRDVPHEATIRHVEPNGWIEVRGLDYEQARAVVVALLGTAWAFQYTLEQAQRSRFLTGEPFLIIDVSPSGAIVGYPTH